MPIYGAPAANELLPCAFWPVPPGPPPHEVAAAGAPPILVIGTTGDPATPYAYSERVAAALDRGTLLTLDGAGHTATFQSSCILRHVQRYLVDEVSPPTDTRCS